MKYLFIHILLAIGLESIGEDTLITFIKSIENDTQKINILYQEGFKLRNTEPKRALQLAIVAEQIAEKNGSPKHLALSFNLLGILEYKRGNFNGAYSYQTKSYKLNKIARNIIGMANNQLNIGNIFSDIKNYPLAEKAYLSALFHYNQLNYIKGNLNCLINLGVLKFNQKEYLSAIKNYQQALQISEIKNDYETKAICCNNIGAILMTINELDSAISYIEESIKIKFLTENEIELADSYNNLAFIYIKKSEFDKAKQFIDSSEIIVKKHNYFEADLELTHTKYMLYQSQKQFELANIWLQKYVNLKDSINGIGNDIELDIEILEQDKTLKTKQNNNYNFYIFIVLLIILFILIFLFLIKNKR